MKRIANLLVIVAPVCVVLLLQLVQAQGQGLEKPVARDSGATPSKCIKSAEAFPGLMKQATSDDAILNGMFNFGFVTANHSLDHLLQVPNPIDDTTFFVRMHYRDFLMRHEPDAPGLAHWSGEITQCGTDAACIDRKRVDVSRAFFFDGNFVALQFPINPNLGTTRGLDPYNRAFVRQCYLTYLQREPNEPPDVDFSGFNHWLNTLNNDPTPDEGYNHLIRAFLISPEYRARWVSPPC